MHSFPFGGKMADPTFIYLNSTDWTAITAIATVVLTLVAYFQISAAREEARINRTLAACDRYDLDPILDAVTRRLGKARDSGALKRNPRRHRHDIYSILNYLESIAIGVQRGLYSSAVVRDQMEPIYVGYVSEYLATGLVDRAEPKKKLAGHPTEVSFDKIRWLVESWSK